MLRLSMKVALVLVSVAACAPSISQKIKDVRLKSEAYHVPNNREIVVTAPLPRQVTEVDKKVQAAFLEAAVMRAQDLGAKYLKLKDFYAVKSSGTQRVSTPGFGTRISAKSKSLVAQFNYYTGSSAPRGYYSVDQMDALVKLAIALDAMKAKPDG